MSNTNLLIGDVLQEWAGTRRLLERLPDERLDWKPHDKSFTLGELATHIVNLLNWQLAILRDPGIDLLTIPARREALASREALLEELDANVRELERTLNGVDEAAMAAEWTLRRGDTIMAAQPRGAAFRTIGMNHMIHHRAQITVYMRLLDLPVPGLYGPSADDLGM